MGYITLMQDFVAPQPFNVAIEPEPDIAPPVRMPVIAPSVPVVAQEITPDRDLYPPRGRGVRPGRVR